MTHIPTSKMILLKWKKQFLVQERLCIDTPDNRHASHRLIRSKIEGEARRLLLIIIIMIGFLHSGKRSSFHQLKLMSMEDPLVRKEGIIWSFLMKIWTWTHRLAVWKKHLSNSKRNLMEIISNEFWAIRESLLEMKKLSNQVSLPNNFIWMKVLNKQLQKISTQLEGVKD